MKTATSQNTSQSGASTVRTTTNWAPLSAIICLTFSLFLQVNAQSSLTGTTWRVLQQSDLSWDASEIQLQREDPKKQMPQTKGNFSFSSLVFMTDQVAMVYTAGYLGDSMAKSSQGYWLADAHYFQVSPTQQLIQIETDGCPEFSYQIEGEHLVLRRHTPQSEKLTFLPQTTNFQEDAFSEAIIQNVASYFDCKQFDELLVTIKTQATEFPRAQSAQIPMLQEERSTLLKAMLYSHCSIQPDQLRILSQVTYTDAPTVSFTFQKSLPWMDNDSLRFEIVPTMSASSSTDHAAYHVRIGLTDKQKEQLNAWDFEDWNRYLHAPSSDYATNLLLYAITLQDIPIWYQKGAHEWKQFGKEADVAKWEKYLQRQVPTVK